MFTCMHLYNERNLPHICKHAQYMHAQIHVSFSTSKHEVGNSEMVQSVRLNDIEQEKLRKKAVELNKALIQKGQQPVRDSELVHILIEEGIDLIEINNSGKLTIPR